MKVKILVVFFVVTFSSSNIFAGTNDDLANDLSSCSKISNDESRLLCFDKLTKSIKPIVKAEKIKPESKNEVDKFSKEHLKKSAEDKGPDSIVATISKVKQLLRGQWVIYFENGQKWQQQDSAKIKLKVGDHIRLKKGALSTVFLYKKGSNRSIRVKRLK